MENWTNLNKLLTLERTSFSKKENETQKLVELCAEDIRKDFKEIKKLLISGAAVNCFSKTDQSTPLITAIRTDNVELGAYLLRVGASISYQPEDLLNNAFWEALKTKKHEFLEMFVEKKCILERDTEKNLIPLIYATIESDQRSVELLLSHPRVKVNASDNLGNTALHYNVEKTDPTPEDIQIGLMLVAAGADTNGRNLAGKTPEDFAVDSQTKSMLLKAKLDRDLHINKEPVVDVQLNKDLGITKTRNNKVKI